MSDDKIVVNYQVFILIFFVFIAGCTSATKNSQRCPSSSAMLLNSQCHPVVNGEIRKDQILNSTMGFEFEGSIPAELEFYEVAEAAKEFLQSKFPGDTIVLQVEPDGWYENSYLLIHHRKDWEDIYSILPEPGVTFNQKTEPNIKPIEITSPVMRTRSQGAIHFELLEHLRSIGLKSRADVEGNHIHWGLSDENTYDELLVAFEMVEKLLDIFLKEFSYSPTRADSKVNLDEFRTVVKKLREFVSKNPGVRIFETQFDPVFTRTVMRVVREIKTVELRIFNSNINKTVNLFEMDFVHALFASAFDPSSPLVEYLKTTVSPDVKTVVQLMGLDFEIAKMAFQWSQKKVKDLSQSLREQNESPVRGRFVLPTVGEISVDLFWKEEFHAETFSVRLDELASRVSERDRNIFLFNLISQPEFETLERKNRQLLLGHIKRNYPLKPFLQKEIWAIEVVEHPSFASSFSQEIENMSREDNSLLHPVIRRMLLRYEKNSENLSADIKLLSLSPKVFSRFSYSFIRYLRLHPKELNEVQSNILIEIIRLKPRPGVALQVLETIKRLRFQMRKNKKEASRILSALVPIAKQHRKVAISLLSTSVEMAQNDLVGPYKYIKDSSQLMDLIHHYLNQGSRPELIYAWVSYLNAFQNVIEVEELKQSLQMIDHAVKRFGSNITGMERINLRLGIKSLLTHVDVETRENLQRTLDSI